MLCCVVLSRGVAEAISINAKRQQQFALKLIDSLKKVNDDLKAIDEKRYSFKATTHPLLPSLSDRCCMCVCGVQKASGE